VIPTGVIFAVLDCDADSIEAWNRWYDLEHTPPNVWLPGVMLSRRYVAPPDLHELRVVDPASAFAAQRGTFITVYTLSEEPAATVAGMSTLRDKLYAEERMNFPPEKKVVRDGDAMKLRAAVSSAEIKLPRDEVPFVGHTAMLVVQLVGSDDVVTWYEGDWAERVVSLDGVHGVMTLQSSRQSDGVTAMIFYEGDAAQQTQAIRAHAPHHPDAHIMADAPFLLIDPLRYPWAEAIRQSSLPKSVA
jgi:hypothetical protein